MRIATATYRPEVVQNISLGFVREDHIRGDCQRAARHERNERGDVRDLIKPV